MQKQVSFASRVAQLRAHNNPDGQDLQTVLNGKAGYRFDEQTNAALNAWGIDTSAIFARTAPSKPLKRFVQFVNAVSAKDYSKIDRTSAIILLSLHLSGEFNLTSDAVKYIATGSKGADVNTRGVSRQTVKRLIGAVGANTVHTQVSRSVGKAGFLGILGLVTGDHKRNQSLSLNRSAPLVQAFIVMIDGATPAQIDALCEQGRKSK